ncbi:MAG: epimerase [bacterium]
MKIRAVLFGATGMVGEGVLYKALEHEDIESVLVVGRRTCGVTHAKMKEALHADFYDYSALEDRLRGLNACFFCLGVTSIGKSEEEYRRSTYDLTMQAARTLSKVNPEMTFCYISGAGTDSSEKGKSMWARVKGKTENDLRTLPFKAVYAFRPGYVKPYAGLKNSYRIAKALGWIYPVLRTLFPKYVCTMEDLALAMINVAREGSSLPVLENPDIARLAQSAPRP